MKTWGEEILFLNEVVSRINNLDWSSVGTVISKENGRLGYEFFRRMASFFQDESLTPLSPKFTDIACLLGDNKELIDIKMFLNDEIIKHMNQFSGIELVCNFYLKLGKYVDDHPEYSKHMSVYEPLLKILERNGAFVFRVHELEIVGVSYFPLGGWYERFLNQPPYDIDSL